MSPHVNVLQQGSPVMIKLYEFPLSGNCHKVRLMLSLLGLAYDSVLLNGASREHKSPDFLALNPLGQVPVLKDGEIIVRDSHAILIYLAHHYGGEQWWPQDSAELASICAWLSTCANEVARGPNALRLHYKFGRTIHVGDAIQVTDQLLSIVEARLTLHDWIATDHLSLGDIALYPYVALSPEGHIDLAPYPKLIGWIKRIQSLPNYVGMPGM